MMNGGMYGWSDAASAKANILNREADGLAGPISSLAGKPVYIFSGTKDTIIPPHSQE
jgi:hypothetical protein